MRYALLLLVLSGCVTERIIYVPIDQDSGVADVTEVADAGAVPDVDAFVLVEQDGSVPDSGVDAQSTVDTGDFPACPGLSGVHTFRAGSNSCIGPLSAFDHAAWWQAGASCTINGRLTVEWCTPGAPTSTFGFEGDWAPMSPGVRGVRFSFDCGGLVHSCTLSARTDVVPASQAVLTCSTAMETCSLNLSGV